jgi:hypothetical protein
MKCCNTEIEIKSGHENGKILYYASCPKCGKKIKADTKKEVENYFDVTATMTQEIQPMPTKPADIVKWGNSNLPSLIQQSAQFIDKPATQRMIGKNLRYVSGLTGKSWDKIWQSKEGQESISYALSESLYYAAILPDMGSIVPFGSIAEFIPSIECYKFALESGRNAPFMDIQIDLVHENDQTENSQEDGNFIIKIKRGIPRGDIIAVVVSAERTDTGKRIGEIYDVERLIKKAEAHSPSYKNFLIERDAFKKLQVEGKLKTDSDGRLYYEKSIEYEKDGQKKTWNKKIYESDLSNPYDGADRPEMLRKAAGKSFFRPYMKTRNASAMADEWQSDPIESRDQAADNVLSRAADQFKTSDAEIIEDVPAEQPAQKQEKQKTKSGKLFDENDDL